MAAWSKLQALGLGVTSESGGCSHGQNSSQLSHSVCRKQTTFEEDLMLLFHHLSATRTTASRHDFIPTGIQGSKTYGPFSRYPQVCIKGAFFQSFIILGRALVKNSQTIYGKYISKKSEVRAGSTPSKEKRMGLSE